MLLSTAQQLNRLSLTSLLFTSCLLQIFYLLIFFGEEGKGAGGARMEAAR